jgi:cytochrome c biogenesis factor
MALHDKMTIGPYTLECSGFTQDSNPELQLGVRAADVYKGGKKQFQMTPEKRVYLASGQPQTMVAIHSVPSGICTWCMKARTPTPASRSSRRSQSAGGLDLGGLVVLVFGTLWRWFPA